MYKFKPSDIWQRLRLDLLLMIIRRIYKYPWIETVMNPIVAVNYNAMCICLQEFIIEDNVPLSLIHLCWQCAIKALLGPFPPKGLKVIWKLSNKEVSIHNIQLMSFSNHLKTSNMFKCVAGWFGPSIFRLISNCQIERPWFSITESSELSAIRGKHQSQYDLWEVAPRLSK
jgi:hypothetical protein